MENNKKKWIIIALSFYGKNLKKHWISFTVLIALSLMISIINLGTVICIQDAVSQALEQNSALINYIVILVVLLVVGTVGTFLLERLTGKIGARISFDIKQSFVEKLMNMHQSDRDKLSTGGLSSQFNYDLGMITSFMPSGMIKMFKELLMALLAILYMLHVNGLLLVVSLAVMPICMIIVNILRRKIANTFNDVMDNNQKGNTVMTEVVHNMSVIKSYNLQNLMFERVKVFYKGALNSWIRVHKLFSPMLMLNIIIIQFPKVFCIIIGSYLALKNHITIENLIGFVLLLDYVVEPLATLPDIITSISNTGVACERVINTFNLRDERQDGEELGDKQTGDVLLKLNDVCFGYEEGSNVIEDVSFELRYNEKIGLIGESGCGKSSLIALLCGFYECRKGRIEIMGRDYNELSLHSIRSKISLVSQDVFILPISVADNIALGSTKKDVSREKIIEVAKAANADSFICSLPDGYDTMLSENGKNLSGGQRQMISVARAFLKDAPIILLDEATSALDASAEATVNHSLNCLIKNKGTIIISHRISSIKDADRILLMKDGRVIKEETFDELATSDPLYTKLQMLDAMRKI